MRLIIDVGNTRVKFAVFHFGNLQYKEFAPKDAFISAFNSVRSEYPSISSAIISSVGKLTSGQKEVVTRKYDTLVLSHEVHLPFYNNYGTPETLGVDRMALMSAAAVQYPNESVLLIDAGSCITYDFITDRNEYLGGAISPGVRMRYEALHTFTANLPLLDTNLPEKLLGDTTASSIHVGVVSAVIQEIDGFINAYKAQFGELRVILTGGDAHFLQDRLKNDIFANSNFLLEGLNHILEFNKD